MGSRILAFGPLVAPCVRSDESARFGRRSE
jgi:hypothetical protein